MDFTFSLLELGWQPYFQQQLSLDDLEFNRIARICSHQESTYELIGEMGLFQLNIDSNMPAMTVGDWVVTDTDHNFLRLLDRRSEFDNIAANIDTVFLLCALNESFNLALIKRYLELTHQAQANAVVVLTKADTSKDADEKRAQVERLDPLLMVEAVNALDVDSLTCLAPWLKSGETVALLGAVGAGKSALINTLMKTTDKQQKRTIGTSNSLQPMPSGALLLDTQGLRELQLTEFDNNIIGSFADILALAEQCRFSDCQHHGEPGCAITAAVADKRLTKQRVAEFLKLHHEDNDDNLKAKIKSQEKLNRTAKTDIRARKHSSEE
ncbi:ribosome small subunit-dependent GTPase A [Marinomonas transparens]|uniref:Ribosome small subunit-dependent GTPase A n=1 Tax=Marinomonas transparens TaxID=2795388 RepID=A0A934JU35_9GAMM|nr:ribosome small subunit-dependent GTPase A [Marinomonas transparens]MBJ7537380.1 ribosome small subunit-dependent GTPase A [Marinomonas transparens]